MSDAGESVTLGQSVADVLPVIVGGALAIAGGIVGTIVTHVLQAKDSARQRRRSKLEELVEHTLYAMHWIERQRSKYMFGETVEDEAPPIGRVEAIGTLYFPELKFEVAAFSLAVTEYSQWYLERGQERLKAGIQQLSSENLASFRKHYTSLSNTRQALLSKCGDVMKALA